MNIEESIRRLDYAAMETINTAFENLPKTGFMALIFLPIGIPSMIVSETGSALWVLGLGSSLVGFQILASTWNFRPSRTFRKLDPDGILKPVFLLLVPLYTMFLLIGLAIASVSVAGALERTSSLAPSRSGAASLAFMAISGSALAAWGAAGLWKTRGLKPVMINEHSVLVYSTRIKNENFRKYDWEELEDIRFISQVSQSKTDSAKASRIGAHFKFSFSNGRAVIIPPARYQISPASIVELLHTLSRQTDSTRRQEEGD